MRFLIYGAGAVGGVLGARLYESGEDVTLLARGDHLRAIQDQGLQIEDDHGARRLRIPSVAEPASARLGASDVVALTVKSQHTSDALAALESAVHPSTAIVCVQNGIDNERQALRRFANVYGAYVSCLATHVEPGVVQAHSTPVAGTVDVGRYPYGTDDRALEIAHRLTAARFDAAAQSDIMVWKHEKLLVNLATVVEALCGPQARTGELARRVLDEGRRTLVAAGLRLPSATMVEMRGAQATTVAVPRLGGSSWQSLSRRTGSVETDFINGEIVLLGRLHSVPTPANELLQRLSARMAAERRSPGLLAESDLLALLDGRSEGAS